MPWVFSFAIVVAASSHTTGAVFDEAANAGPFQAYYGNWGVDANAADPAPNSYNNYRKTDVAACPSLDNCDLPSALADEADPDVATWSNMSHPANPLKSPGMFIGQSPSTTSYEDNVFFLGGIFDFEGGGMNGDSISRTEWDFRVGFLEDPEEFVGVRQPNDESWDLWAGQQHNPAGWGTDGVSLQLVTGATDNVNSSPIGSTDQHVRANAIGIVLQAGGAPASTLAHEGNREGFGAGVQTTEMMGFGPQGMLEPHSATTDTDAAYNDNLDISFWMEEAAGGDVNFIVTVGEVVYQQSFDPGSADDPKTPNPNNDPNNPFTDGFFDWQNATPVIFVGAIGGTVGATGIMGFRNPNPSAPCDFDQNGVCDIIDLDELMYTGLGGTDPKYDLNGSGGVIDLDDRDAFLLEVDSLPGDSDLSGMNDAADLNALGTHWQADNLMSWADGDFNGDASGDAADLNELGIWWQKTGADFAAAQAASQSAVPEPASSLWAVACLLGLMATRRRHL
jgi:hypothetical protein